MIWRHVARDAVALLDRSLEDELTPEAWLKQAHNDLALAELAKDNGFMAQPATTLSSREKALKVPCRT